MAIREGEIDGGRVWFSFSPAKPGGDGEEAAGELTVGVTLVTCDQLGEVERITFPDDGDKISKGDILFSLEGTMDTYEWPCPISATVTEVNQDLLEEPETLSEDPQEAGWLVRLEIQDEKDLEALTKEDHDESSYSDDDEDDDEDEEDELEEWDPDAPLED